MSDDVIFQDMQRIGAGPIQIFYSTHLGRWWFSGLDRLREVASDNEDALLLLILAVFCPGAEGRWLRLKTPNFELYTDAGESRGREVDLELEQYRNGFAAQASGRNISPLPVRVFVFRSDASLRAWRSGRRLHRDARVGQDDGRRGFGEGIAEFYSTIQLRGRQTRVGEPVAPRIQKSEHAGS